MPLAGDAEVRTVGGDLVGGGDIVGRVARPRVGGVIVVALVGLGLARRPRTKLRRRQRRGRWGLLQDRFTELTDRHRSPDQGIALTNPRRGDLLREAFGPDAAVEQQVAIVVEALDQAAFDPLCSDNQLIDAILNDTTSADPRAGAHPGIDYAHAAEALASLERLRPSSRDGGRRLTCS